jgi:hypothetical protein
MKDNRCSCKNILVRTQVAPADSSLTNLHARSNRTKQINAITKHANNVRIYTACQTPADVGAKTQWASGCGPCAVPCAVTCFACGGRSCGSLTCGFDLVLPATSSRITVDDASRHRLRYVDCKSSQWWVTR